jgi:magnesium chelatase family protein
VAVARSVQAERAARFGEGAPSLNARADGQFLEKTAGLDEPARTLLARAAEQGNLTARGWTRTIRLARTIADLDGCEAIRRVHVAEALIYRRVAPGVEQRVDA